MVMDLYDLLDDKDFMNALAKAALSKDVGAFDKLVEQESVRKRLSNFILECRVFSSNNKEKCEVCNLRFTCYTTK